MYKVYRERNCSKTPSERERGGGGGEKSSSTFFFHTTNNSVSIGKTTGKKTRRGEERKRTADIIPTNIYIQIVLMIRRVCVRRKEYPSNSYWKNTHRERETRTHTKQYQRASIIIIHYRFFFSLLLSCIKHLVEEKESRRRNKRIVDVSLNCLRYSRLIFYRKQQCQSYIRSLTEEVR